MPGLISNNPSPAVGLFKVAFELPEEARRWAPGGTELMWVEKTAVRGQGVVRNVPFYVKGVACGDAIRVRVDHAERQLVFDGVAARSGNSTVRVIVKSDSVQESLESALIRSACTWEVDSTGLLWAVDVPAAAAYDVLRECLESMIDSARIAVEEAYISPKHMSDLTTS